MKHKFQIYFFYVSLLQTLLVFPAAAQSGAEYFFQQGNQAYRSDDLQDAIVWYQKILDTGYESSNVHYNLGNCYYKLNDIGRAVLHYEKALQLTPDDQETSMNLELANLKVRDRIVMPVPFVLIRWWGQLKGAFTTTGWTKLTLALYILTILLLIARWFLTTGILGRIIPVTLIGSLIVMLCSSFLLYHHYRDSRTDHAVILTRSVNVLSAPEENSTDVFMLHEGVKVQLTERRGEWIKIELPDGTNGWLRQEYLGII